MINQHAAPESVWWWCLVAWVEKLERVGDGWETWVLGRRSVARSLGRWWSLAFWWISKRDGWWVVVVVGGRHAWCRGLCVVL